MELNQLNYFRTVARLQNVTKAADELYISQPNLSTAITKLESSLGVSLFERKKGKIKLTPNGELFLAHVNRAFQELDDGLDAIKERTEYTEDKIVVGSVFGGLLNLLFERYLSDYGLLPTGQFTYSNALLERLIAEKTLDFAIMSRRPENQELEWLPLCEDELVAAVLAENSLSRGENLDLSKLRGAHFICNETLFDKESLDTLCKEADFVPNVVRVYNEFDFPGSDVMDFGNNLIIHPSFFSHRFLDKNGDSVVIKRFENHYCKIELGLARLRNRSISPLSEDFFEYIHAELAPIVAEERERLDKYRSQSTESI